MDCIHVCVFHISKNSFKKLARYLLDTLLFVELFQLFLIAISIASRHLVDRSRKFLPPQQLLDSWWIDRAFVLASDGLFLDTSSILVSVDDHFLDTFLDSCLDTSQHLHMLRFTGAYIISSCDPQFISFDLFLDSSLFFSPRHPHLTPILILKVSSSFFKIFLTW